jgi:2-polyprenyl-3-methyl-5-hydroxy-6-metoxy-1,4-benzoquinol methylase
MKLPSHEECSNDQLLTIFREGDSKEYFSNKKSSNQFLLNARRVEISIDLISKYLTKSEDSTIADFACGPGNVGLLFAEKGYKVDFVDNESKFFDYIKLKHTHGVINFVKGDLNSHVANKKYSAIYLGEAIEHMADPLLTLKNLRENLVTGGLLCLTTPNGDFVNCYEPSWSEVKNNKERNKNLANTIGNHVCEFTTKELSDLLKEAGFGVLEHHLINSWQISERSLLRRVLSKNMLFKLDSYWSKQKNKEKKDSGRTQVILAQRFH